MPFDFGCARGLYRRRVHPRVLFGPRELDEMRARTRRGPGAAILNGMRRKVAPIIERVLTAKDLPGMIATWNHKWDYPGTAVVWGLFDTAMIGVLDQNDEAITAARRVLRELPAADAIQGRGGKTVGYGMESYSLLAYDVLHGVMDRAERKVLNAWLLDFWVRFTLASRGTRYFRHSGGNIALGELLTGLCALLLIDGEPGVPNLAAERNRMLLMLEASLHTAIGVNGYPAEDIGYGSGMGGLLAYMVEAVRRAGLYDVFDPQRGSPSFARFGRAMLHFVQPWGENLSNTGDHGDDFGERGFVLARLASETSDPALLWLLGTLYYPTCVSGPRQLPTHIHGDVTLASGYRIPGSAVMLSVLDDLQKPVHPSRLKTPTAFMDADRGIVTFRSNWKPDATFLVFDGCRRNASAQGHAHDSGGHFSLSALGEYFAIDTGRYNIEQDQHNVVLVDGKSGQSTNGQWRAAWHQANLLAYEPGPFVDFASADNAQQANCYWSHRHVGLVKDAGGGGNRGVPAYAWTVDDVNFANDYREFWWALNTHPDNRIRINGKTATIEGCRGGNLLDLHWCLPDPKAFPKPHRLRLAKHLHLGGSRAYIQDPLANARAYRKFGDLVHGPVFARPRLVAKVAGYNGRFLSLMLPRLAGERPARVQQLPTLENALAVRITFAAAGVEDTLIWAYEHQLLEAGDVSARGDWVLVRRALRGGRRIVHAGRQLAALAIDGRKVKV